MTTCNTDDCDANCYVERNMLNVSVCCFSVCIPLSGITSPLLYLSFLSWLTYHSLKLG